MAKRFILIAFLLGLSPQARANAIPFNDYIFLREGMSQAEVLLRVGPPDFVSVVNTFFIYTAIWYYLPDPSYSGTRLTELTFDFRGKVIDIERKNPLKRKFFP